MGQALFRAAQGLPALFVEYQELMRHGACNAARVLQVPDSESLTQSLLPVFRQENLRKYLIVKYLRITQDKHTW